MDSIVYAIAAGDYIKIGTTTDLIQRMSSLQGANPIPLDCLGVAEGDESLERCLHQRFAHGRTLGEWFLLKPEDRSELLELLPQVPFFPATRGYRAREGKTQCLIEDCERLPIRQGYCYRHSIDYRDAFTEHSRPLGGPIDGDMDRSIMFNVRMPRAMLASLDRRAKAERLTRSDLVRRLLEGFLAENGQTPDERELGFTFT